MSKTKSATKIQVQTPGKSKFTKEEERLLLEGSQEISTKTTAIFYLNSFIVASIPTWYYHRVQMMDLLTYSLFFIIMVAVNTYLLAVSYIKWRHYLRHKIAGKREAAVTREIVKQLEIAGKMKSVTKQEKEERISLKKNQVADSEATAYSIFLNNAIFFVILLIFSSIFLRNNSPIVNYIASTGGAGLVVWLLSVSS